MIYQVFGQEMPQSIDEGQKGRQINGLILKVECTENAKSAS